jgi:hypothetical protein
MERSSPKTVGLTAMLERDYHLAEADRRIVETKQLISCQREWIAVLRLSNQPSAAAMLEALERA